jgi:hypothetical protein
METLGDISVTETSKTKKYNYECTYCHYKCIRKYNLDRHILSPKHKMMTENEQLLNYTCKFCNKCYESRNGLWKHNKNCSKKTAELDNGLVMMLINDNKELKNLVLEICKEKDEYKTMMMKIVENGTHNTTHTNSHNKAFNLNFFLNETCKDAMNITEFVDSIKLQLSDLEKVGEFGYVEGITKIIVKNLKNLDITKRPVHCTDKKRETMYVKDDNKWEKDENQSKLHKFVRRVADKNARLLPVFKEKYPDCFRASSKYSDQYNKLIVESMGGSGDNDFEKEEKIIKNISKEVVL